MAFSPTKTIFNISYKPQLLFYEKLYQDLDIFKIFTNWETDRLKINLRDYENNQSITLSHKVAIHESDSFDNKIETKYILSLLDTIPLITNEKELDRFGNRHYYLLDLKLNFNDMVDIINTKYFTNEFKSIFNNTITDSSIVIDTIYNNNKVKINMGPIRKNEIERFFRFNIENHSDPSLHKRVETINNYMNSLPDISLFVDIDYSTNKDLSFNSMQDFYNNSKKDIKSIIEDIERNFVEIKAK